MDRLKTLHLWAFSFDFDEYKASLEFACEGYLQAKMGDAFDDRFVERMARFLLRRFKKLTSEEEFAKALLRHKCEGTKQDDLVGEDALSRQRSGSQEVSLLGFYRDYLKASILEDPYASMVEVDDNGRTTRAFDLDALHELGLAIYGSADNIPLEMDFGEILGDVPGLSSEQVIDFLSTMQRDLGTRARLFADTFGGLRRESPARSGVLGIPIVAGATAQARGRLFEQFASAVFRNEPGFAVHTNVARSDQELDIVVLNRVDDPFWASLQSPFLIVECRNRKRKAQAKDLRDFEVKLRNFGGLARLGIMVSVAGFTRECLTAAKRCCREQFRILLADAHGMAARLREGMSTREWIEALLLEQL